MIQPGERIRRSTGRAVIAPWFRLQSTLLISEVRIGSVELAQLGLIALAFGLQTIVMFSPGHFRPANNAFFAILVPAATVGSLVLSALAALPLKRVTSTRTRKILAVLAVVLFAGLSVIGAGRTITGISAMVSGSPYGNDGAAMDLLGAERVLHGHNPYINANIGSALAAINAPATTTTPLMQGRFAGLNAYPSDGAIQQVFNDDQRYHSPPQEFESKYNYPAGSFLFILPFVAAGFQDMRFLYALAIVAMGAYIWWRMARALRPLVPLVLLSDLPVVNSTASGQPDPIYGLFLLIGFAEWTSPWLSPVFMGLAVGTKQLAWFAVPLYLVVILRSCGWRELMRRSAIVGAVALGMNAPFILQSPTSYLSGIGGPLIDPMFPLGIGIVALFVSNVLPMLPKIAFTVMELASWLGATVSLYRLRSLPPAVGVALAALPLFFAWRSLVNYFYLVPLICLAVTLADAKRSERLPVRT